MGSVTDFMQKSLLHSFFGSLVHQATAGWGDTGTDMMRSLPHEDGDVGGTAGVTEAFPQELFRGGVTTIRPYHLSELFTQPQSMKQNLVFFQVKCKGIFTIFC